MARNQVSLHVNISTKAYNYIKDQDIDLLLENLILETFDHALAKRNMLEEIKQLRREVRRLNRKLIRHEQRFHEGQIQKPKAKMAEKDMSDLISAHMANIVAPLQPMEITRPKKSAQEEEMAAFNIDELLPEDEVEAHEPQKITAEQVAAMKMNFSFDIPRLQREDEDDLDDED